MASEVGLSGLDLPRLLVGVALFLAPGAAWAWAGLAHLGWARLVPVALVLSFTLEPAALLLLNLAFGVPVTLATGAYLSAALATGAVAYRWRRPLQATVSEWLPGEPMQAPSQEGPPPAQGRPRALAHAGLLAALVVVGLVAYLPHLDVYADREDGQLPPGFFGVAEGYREFAVDERDDYEYTLHVDENLHWAFMAQLQRQDTLRFDEPFTGEPPGGLYQLKGSVHEKGFHLALAQFQELTGAPWPVVFRFLPTLWMMTTAWAVWALLQPWRGAPVAAALTALVPTTARFIGPGFLVPIGFGLAWIPVVALLAQYSLERRRNATPFVVCLAWAFFVHVVAGLACLLLVAAMLPALRERRRAAVLVGAALVPVVWLVANFWDELATEATKFGVLPTSRRIFDQLGTPFLLAWAFGSFLVFARPPKDHRALIGGATLASVATFLMIASNLHFGLENYFLYERWHQPFALFATVPVAYLLVEAASLVTRARRLPNAHAWSVAALVLLTGAVAHAGVEGHLRERYYHVLSDDDWASITWAEDHLGPEYGPFLADPWKAPVINAVTGKRPVTVLYPGTPPYRGEVYVAYALGGYQDSIFLVENDVTWVLDAVPTTAPEYEPLGPGVYGLRSPYLEAYNQATGSAGP